MDPPTPPPIPNPQGVPPTNLQHSYTKGIPHPLPPTSRDYSHINGPPYPTPYPQPTGSTTHQLTTLIH